VRVTCLIGPFYQPPYSQAASATCAGMIPLLACGTTTLFFYGDSSIDVPQPGQYLQLLGNMNFQD